MKHKTVLWAAVPVLAVSLFLLSTGTFAFSIIPLFPETATTTVFGQTINPGILSVNIVDGGYGAVGSPTVQMNGVTFGFACQTATGTFGTATQQIYVKNPDAADNGWVVSLAASAPTASWISSVSMDFNDPDTDGCADGIDPDSIRGQMTVNPNAGILVRGACLSCTATSVTKGFSAEFNEETGRNSITIMTGAAASADVGDWLLTGVAISQKIPGEQPAANNYSISLVLSIVAS